MISRQALDECQDPLVSLVLLQGKAIELMRRGLRPKQVCIMTDLPIKKVQNLYRGLLSAEQRAARAPRSASTLLRHSKTRVAASMLVAVYRRFMSESGSPESDKFERFVEVYDFYRHLAECVREVTPILSIEDAFTLIYALHSDEIVLDRCETHDISFVLVHGHQRGQGCPNCAFEAHEMTRKPSTTEAGVNGAMPKIGCRPVQCDEETAGTVSE